MSRNYQEGDGAENFAILETNGWQLPDCRITEQLGLEGTLKFIQFQPHQTWKSTDPGYAVLL